MSFLCNIGIHKFKTIHSESRSHVRIMVENELRQFYEDRLSMTRRRQKPISDTSPTLELKVRVCTRCGYQHDAIHEFKFNLEMKYRDLMRLREEHGLSGDPSEIAKLID